MRLWVNGFLRLLSGAFFGLTSLYCLMAFLPYTYTAFIKAPPYPWMPWLAQHQQSLTWCAVGAALVAELLWPVRAGKRAASSIAACGVLASFALVVTARPFLQGIPNSDVAYGWAILALVPALAVASLGMSRDGGAERPGAPVLAFAYRFAGMVAVVISASFAIAERLRSYLDSHSFSWSGSEARLTVWTLVSHVALALIVVSVVNLSVWIAGKTTRPRLVMRLLLGGLIAVTLWAGLGSFLQNAMGFDGWRARVYAGCFAATLTLLGFSLIVPALNEKDRAEAATPSGDRERWRRRAFTWAFLLALFGLTFASRSLIGGEDWNGVVENTWTLVFWIGMTVGLYRLWPARKSYPVGMIVAVLCVTVAAYYGLQSTQIFWARPLGATDDEISMRLETYAGEDGSFQLVRRALGAERSQDCQDLCRILREHTNIRENGVSTDVKLVEKLERSAGEHPNIFIFVVDSMRPDYLGAYNPKVTSTPNLDALARDSVVFRNAYAHYVGTSLSEPSIWAGALLLHTHFPQPFARVNSLQKLAETDGYELMVSFDTVLGQVLSQASHVVKLDTDKSLWNQYEVCSTVTQLEGKLDQRKNATQPVLFYAQPMNVHQFARNTVPTEPIRSWPTPEGMVPRISYEVHWVDGCIGQFVSYLKQRHLYDDSVIVVTSDHGDATGEFGRSSHSTSIWPEIMRVPLIVHLPKRLRENVVFDVERRAALTDIAPSLYYLLGHRPIQTNPLYGRPLFAETREELESYPTRDFFVASDMRAVYGILTADSRYLYVTYDSPARSYLFDLQVDPHALNNIVTPARKQQFDTEIINDLQGIGDFYGYKPGVGALLASRGH